MSDHKLQVIPLGGLGEFGMNCLALRYNDDIIVIDAGMMFPDAELMGVDVVIPDFTYLQENREKVRALILTHGHEDHIGGVPFLLRQMNIPVYGTALTLALVARRLEEHDLDEKPDLHEVSPGDEIEAGPFTIECIHVTHSITSSLALGIRTPMGLVVHTGDFKIDQTPMDDIPFDLHKFAEYGKEGVLLLLSDSTNVDRAGFTESERAVRPRLEDLFRRANGRLVISCFSSSIHRMQHILDLAKENGRKVAFLGRSMLSVSEISHNLGLLHIPDNILLRQQDIMQVPADKVCVVLGGTQGEPMSALARVAVDNHKHLSLRPRDLVVLSARIIPGNEKPIYRMINHMARRGSEVVYGTMNPPVHVSGHASVEELKLILALVKPQYFMPVHGEYRQLVRHAKLASEVVGAHIDESFVIESGETLEIGKRGAKKGEPVAVGRVCIDSGSVDEVVEDMVIRDRRHLSEDGFVLPIIVLNKHTGKSESLPEIVSRGFKSLEDAGDLMKEARVVVARTLENSSAEERTDWGVMQEKIRTDLRRFINKQTSRRPLIMPVILEV